MIIFFFKQMTAYEMRISDWSSDVCSSDLVVVEPQAGSVGEVVALAGVVGHRPGGVDEGALHERRTRPARLVGAGRGIDREQLVVSGDHLLARAVEPEPALPDQHRPPAQPPDGAPRVADQAAGSAPALQRPPS